MGEAYVSVTDGAYASYWNPAGLAGIENQEFSATYNSSFEISANNTCLLFILWNMALLLV